jgi:hypothetical protein
MFGNRKSSKSQQVSTPVALLVAAVCLAFVPLSPRNALQAADSKLSPDYTFAQLDSLFRTHYPVDEPDGENAERRENEGKEWDADRRDQERKDAAPGEEEGTGWEPFNRFSWFYGQRAYPTGDIPAGARMLAWQQKQEFRNHSPLDENWSAIGPTNMAGRILCIVWHPTDANTIYAGTASGGLFKTTDGGANWFPLTDDLPSLAVGAVALEPGNPNVIYIGTGEGSFNADAVYGAGVFKSTDAGATWNVTGLNWTQSQNRAINKIVIDPTNTQIIYAACNRVVGGIFKSVNGGSTWTQYHTGDVKDIILHPDSVNVLYCATGDPWGNSLNGIFRSENAGVTWTRLNNGLPAATTMGRAQLSMAGSNHQTLYVGISQTISAGAGLLGVYKTTDAGATWTLQATAPNFYGGQGWYDLVIAVHPTNAATVFSSGLDCYKSTDSGVTWTRKTVWSYPPGNSQYAHADHHELIFKPGDPNTILVGTDGGIFKSTNGGDTWIGLNNGLACYQFYAMGNDALNASVCYGGTQDCGTNKYTGSNSWTWVMSGDGGYCNVDYTNSNIVYSEIQRGTHYKSTNAGGSWSTIQNGISGYGEWVTPVAMDPTNPNVLYTGTTQVYKTANGGASWTAISSSLSSYYISTLAVAPSNQQVIYAGIAGGGLVWKTVDGGTNWTSVSAGLPNRYVTRVAVHPSDPSTVYVTLSGYANAHVWKSTNGGASWTNASTGLPDIPCNALAIDGSSPNTLYLGTDLGVYHSTDGGASWSDYSAGLPNVVIDDLALHPTTGTLRAATHGRGMWETSTGGTPSLTVLTPNGGDTWPIGTAQSVTWGTGGLGGNVLIELNRTYPGGSWEVLASSTPNDGSFSWAVSGATTTTARVRITSVETPSANDISNGDFSITPPLLSLLEPNGGETYVLGTVDTISWVVTGTPGAVVVQLNRTYPSASWETIATTSGTSTPYTVSGAPSNTVRVRIYLQSNPSVGDTSAANFAIVAPSITVNWPNGGETLTPGQSVMLRWTSSYVTGTVRVELNRTYPGGTWVMLNANVAMDSLQWTVDQFGGASARIRVTSNTYSAATDVSNANFTISTPVLTMVSPNGGEAWDLGTSHWLRWNRSNLNGLVNVYYNVSYPGGPWLPVQLNVALDSVLWVVPGPVSGTARIRVSSVNLSTFYDESDGNFSMGSGITLVWPNGGENLSLTTPVTIAWTRANAPGNVTIQLNRSYPVGTWETLTSGVSGDTYVWTVSGATTTGARIRVYLASAPTVGDTSDASFSIVSSVLTITSPNGGELWNTHMYQTVRWTRTNVPGDVTVLLDHSYPSGIWDTLGTGIVADTLRYWIPDWDDSTATARVRVVWEDQPVILDDGNANFSIVPHLILHVPNGGEVWPVASNQVIRWSRSNSPGDVRILLTRTWPVPTWSTLSTSASADTFAWVVPAGVSETARIAIYMMSDWGYTDTSAANFTIPGTNSITVTSPNGGEVWPVGTSQTVNFVRSNASGAATVQLNRTYPGGTWETLNSNVVSSSYTWTVSGATSTTARVRVYLNSNPSLRDSSNANFSITAGSASLALTVPNGGETWAIGSTQILRFTRSSAPGNVVILLNRSYPGGAWETLASTVTVDTFAWNVNGAASATSRVRIYLASDANVADTSNANFNIVVPTITVTAPNGGESWAVGSTQNVTFTRINANGNATVEVNRTYPSGAWEVLSTTVNGSSYSWLVSGATSATARVRVYLTASPAIGDTSNAYFSITNSPSLTLTSPNGGETWVIGFGQVVRFTRANAAGNVTVLLNRTYPGGTWETLSASVIADTFAWTASGSTSTTARVRIFLNSNSSVGDTSASNFTIAAPVITVTAPNGGESWTVGSAQTISFTRSNANGNATVEINRTYPSGAWEVLSTTVSTNSYGWSVSGATSSTVRARVYLTALPSVGDTSNANFSIVPAPVLSLTAPNGGETWVSGTTQTVRFTRTNAPGNVTVQLNRAYPGGAWEVLSSVVTADTFAWLVSNPATSFARIKIFLNSNSAVGDTSASNFTIVTPTITVTAPNGGETWGVGSTQTINFNRSNANGNATVELNRTYPSGAWEVLSTTVGGSSYSWLVAGAASTTARVRVYLTATPGVGDTSNANFTITSAPMLTVIAPNGGENWNIGSPQTITFNRNNAPGTATVEVNRSYPGGAWELISNTVAGSSLSWTPVGAGSTTARVRVYLNADTTVTDISNANFTLVAPSLTVTAPNGGDTLYTGTTYTISWVRQNASGGVTVEINRDYPAGAWEVITSNSTVSSYVWTVSTPTTNNARIRVTLNSNPAVGDISNGDFRVVTQLLTLITPNGGETYTIGGPLVVRWSRSYASGAVSVLLNRTYPAGSWQTLTTTATADSFVWTANGTATAAARIKIQLTINSSINDISAANFSLVVRTLALTSHNSPATYYSGSPSLVSFSRTNASGDVTVQLNRIYPSGSWETLTTSDTASSYLWNVNDPPAAAARLRIFMTAEPFVGDTSNANFTIATPSLVVSTPNGGEGWTVDSVRTISWVRNGVTENVRLELNRNYPAGAWETLLSSYAGNSFAWTVTSPSTSSARVRVTGVTTGVTDLSDANFSITSAQLLLLAPNGGENYVVGNALPIRWLRNGAVGAVAAYLNRDFPFGNWEFLGLSSVDSLVWTSNGAASAAARVRIYLLSNPSIADTSNANFTLTVPSISLSAPNGGEQMVQGTSYVIAWSRQSVSDPLRILLNLNYPAGAWTTLASNLAGNSYAWTVTQAPTLQARVIVQDQLNPAIGDTSAANFAIIHPQLTVLEPNGGEQYVIGLSYFLNIARIDHPEPVTIELNRSYPSATWETLVTGFTGNSFSWLANSPYSTTARIRVVSDAYPTVGDTSDANFRVAPFGIIVDDPNGADTFAVGDSIHLGWMREGVGSVDVLLDREWPSGSWEPLTEDLDADSFMWLATPPASSSCRFLVHAHADSTIADTSDSDISIYMPTLTLVSPAGGETFSISDAVTVAWTRTYAHGAVRIELDRNFPSGVWELISDNNNGNSALWTVNGDSTSHARMRLTLVNRPFVKDTCEADFRIAYPGLHLTSPNGNDTLVTGTTQIIRWHRTNAPGQVRVDLDRNYPSGAWEVLAPAVVTDTLVWSVTGPATTNARFRITLVFNGALSDVSDANSWITPPVLHLVTPQAGDSIEIGTSAEFAWSRVGVSPGVNVYVKRNYPSGQWELLGQNLPSDDWTWTAAGAASDVARFRVLSVANPAIGDTTDGAVHLGQPQLSFTNPVSTQTYRAGEIVNLAWTRSYAPGSVRVELSRQGTGGPWEELGTTTGNSLAWTVSGPPTTIARLRITLIDLPWVAAMTSFNSTIVIPSLAITAPSGTGPFAVGRDLTITWQRSYVTEPINVFVERDGDSLAQESIRSSVSGDSVHWTATLPVSSNARIIIRTASGLFVEAQSNAFILAQPQIALTNPAGGQSFVAGSVLPIRWTRSIVLDPVSVALNRDYPDGVWNLLSPSVTDTVLNWTVTGPTTENARIRVLSTMDPALGDTLDSSIALLVPTLTILTPAEGTRVPIGFDLQVAWSRIAVEGNVTLELSRNGGTTYEPIQTGIAGDSYLWTPDGSASNNARLRVTSVANPSVSATSALFILAQPILTLLNPLGGDSIALGLPLTVRWTETDHPAAVNVELDRSYPSDVWETLAGAVESDSFVWTPSGNESHHARIRVESDENSNWNSQSIADFALLNPGLELTSPAAGTELITGDPLTVSWLRTLVPGSLRVLLRHADGNVIVLGQNLSGDSLIATVPLQTSSSSMLVVEDMLNSTRADSVLVTGPFIPRLYLLNIADGGRCVIGRPETIIWSREHADGEVSLEVSEDYPVASWQTVGTTTDDSITFVPEGHETDSLAMRIVLNSRPNVADTVLGIRVVDPSLQLAELAELNYRIGSSLTVTWSNHEVDGTVQLALNRSYPSADWDVLYTGTDTSFIWTVSGNETDAARLRIVSADYPQAADTSDANLSFYIPSLSLNIDTAGDTLFIGHELHYNLTFEHESPLADFAVQRVTDGPWDVIQTGLGEGLHVWTLTGPPSPQLRFRAYVPGDSDFDDTSSVFALLAPALDFLATPPAVVNAGDTVHVIWSVLGVDSLVNVRLLRGVAPAETLLASSVATAFDWVVNPPRTDSARLIVTSMNEPQFADTSSIFAIRVPELLFTNPVTEGTDTVGHVITISWTWVDDSGAVRLEISRDGVGGPWNLIADSIAAASYDYLIDGPFGIDVRYRIVSVVDSAIFAVSVPRHLIAERLSIDEFGGGTWYVGEQHWIRWTRENCTGPVDLQVQRLDRSQPWEQIAQSLSDSLLWTVTGPATDYAMLRLVLTDHPDVFDTTDTPFHIAEPRVTVVAPNGGETIEAGQPIRLRWEGVGFEGGVGIGLWRGDPVNHFDTLFVNTPNDSSEIWTVTGPAATGCYLVVVSESNPALFDTSDAPFVIQGGDAIWSRLGQIPKEYELSPAYPNPFNGQTTIEYAMPKSGRVTVVIFDVLGREVQTLVNTSHVAGYYRLQWDASLVGSGVYFVRMSSAEFVATRKLYLIK